LCAAADDFLFALSLNSPTAVGCFGHIFEKNQKKIVRDKNALGGLNPFGRGTGY
jgi:hypothetical protein